MKTRADPRWAIVQIIRASIALAPVAAAIGQMDDMEPRPLGQRAADTKLARDGHKAAARISDDETARAAVGGQIFIKLGEVGMIVDQGSEKPGAHRPVAPWRRRHQQTLKPGDAAVVGPARSNIVTAGNARRSIVDSGKVVTTGRGE